MDFTREGAHSDKRILFHEDITGKEITSKLLAQVKKLPNVKLMEYTTMEDLITKDNTCYGAVVRKKDGTLETIQADCTALATGGIGGIYRHSTNFRHLTGDALAIAIRHGIELQDINYVQIHPTTFYSKDDKTRSFLISESVRGEGAKLYGKNMERFANELLPERSAVPENSRTDGEGRYRTRMGRPSSDSPRRAGKPLPEHRGALQRSGI